MNITNEILQSLTALNNLNFNDLNFSDSCVELNEDERLEVKKFNPYLSNCDLLIKLFKDKTDLLPHSYLKEKLKDYNYNIAYQNEAFWILVDKQLSNKEYNDFITEFYNKYQFDALISDLSENDDDFKKMIDKYKI